MTGLETGLSAIVVVGSAAVGWVGLRLKPLEDKDEANRDAIDDLGEDTEKRFQGLHDDIKDEREKFERRLADIEKTYLSRADLTAAIKDMRDNMDRSVDRLEAVVRALGVKVDHLAERVGKVEGMP
jgi:hypothetical protein